MLPNYQPKEENPLKPFAKQLRKGDVITPQQIAELTGADESDPKWLLTVLGLRDAIMRIRKDLQLKTEKGALRVLLDKEAGDYDMAQVASGVKQIRKYTRLMMNRIDTSKLSTDERRRLDQNRYVANVLTMGIGESIRTAKRELGGSDS